MAEFLAPFIGLLGMLAVLLWLGHSSFRAVKTGWLLGGEFKVIDRSTTPVKFWTRLAWRQLIAFLVLLVLAYCVLATLVALGIAKNDRHYMLFFAVVALVVLLAVADPFEIASPSHRTLGGLMLGPSSILYGVWGLRRGDFPELSQAKRDGNKVQFWFCFAAFIVIGLAISALGVRAIVEL